MRTLVLLCLIFPLAAQASLLKCTDSKGKVTYTNSPCTKVGLKQAAVIPDPPPPVLDAPVRTPQAPVVTAVKNAAPAPAAAPVSAPAPVTEIASLPMMKSAQTGGDQCSKLNAAMGKIMDDMDAARGQPHSADRQADWDESLQKLQAEKSRLSCF